MTKAIGALLAGLLLSGVAAALYSTFRHKRAARSSQDQEQATATQGARQHRLRAERRPRSRGGLVDLNACTLQDLVAL